MALNGEAQVYPIGGEMRTFRFVPNPVLMFEYHFTLDMVQHALA